MKTPNGYPVYNLSRYPRWVLFWYPKRRKLLRMGKQMKKKLKQSWKWFMGGDRLKWAKRRAKGCWFVFAMLEDLKQMRHYARHLDRLKRLG